MILLLLVSLVGTVWTGWLAMLPAYHASIVGAGRS